MTALRNPRPSRPFMRGYDGYVDRVDRLLAWEWALDRLRNTHNYLLITTRPDGRPHAMPVWGLWLDNTFLFSTGGSSRKAKNLTKNRRCVVCTEQLHEAVIVEGIVATETDAKRLHQFKEAYKEKYDWEMETVDDVYAVLPRVAFGMLENQSDEVGGVTRWTFDA